MTKDRQKQRAAKNAAAIGDRTGKSDCPVIVVGIGAPASGLKPLQQLFAKMPPGHGVAFVLIQHPEPAAKKVTLKLLKKQTSLAVVEATEGMPVLADRIHVIPPDKFLNVTGSRLTLQEPVLCDGLRMPIDHFFCSLAVDQKRRGCGILLSGTGSDGTLGLSEIKAGGGKTFVEDPGSAGAFEMQGAIDSGVTDAVLPAEAMAEAIVALAEQVRMETRNGPAETPEFDADLRAILDIVRTKVGHDFRCYKPNTLVRRVRRRMTLAMVAAFADYAQFLREHPDEVGLLQKDLLIGVTEFFRQPQAWEILGEKVIAPLVENAQPGSEIRVWVPGCSAGKEVYSLAILLAEQVEKAGKKVSIQIFATDSDTSSLATARNGSYSEEEIGENVSPERLKRFFVRNDGRYQVIKDIREQVVFAPQNLTADPPFSRLDLLSCRNLLIYLDQEVQKKIIALFHFALREGGFLFLGTAETIGDREDLFEAVSKKWRIYRRIGVGRPVGVEIPVRPAEPLAAAEKVPVIPPPSRISLASAAQQMLLDRFAPACVMIDRKLQVLYVHGTVENYLTFPAGELTTRVVEMAREGLRARLRGAIGKCLEIRKPVSVTARVRRGKKSMPVKATVSPLRYPREADGLLLITFEDIRVSTGKLRRQAAGESDIHQLEDELKVTREELQSTIEQLENSNDQLKASNEEVTAANEELQSANEEMETSKEELQSLNEELNTINARLHEKVDELEGVNNDVVNLLSSTNIATVFLDKELKVRRFTPASTLLLSLIPSDVGRPIVDVLRHFSDEALLDEARRVLADLTPLSKEVQTEDGRWYIRRITPYRTQDDRIEGVVITFVDVCDLKATEEALRRQQGELETARTEAENGKRRLEAVMEALPVGVAITDAQGGNIHSNSAFEQVWGEPRAAVNSFSDYAVYKAWWPESGKAVAPEEWASARAVRKGESVVGQLLKIRRFDGSQAFVLNSASPIRDGAGSIIGSAVAIQNITDLRKVEEALRDSQHRLAVIVDSIADGFFSFDREWRFTHINDAALRHYRMTREETLGRTLFEVFPGARGTAYENEYRHAMESGEAVHFEAPSTVSDKTMEIHAYPGPENLTVLFRDVTERHRMAAALRESLERAAWLARFPEENPSPVARVSADGSVLYRNPAAGGLAGWACEVGQPVPAPLLPLVGQAMTKGGETQQEVELGGRFYFVSVTPFPVEGYANIYGLDITDRRQAEGAVLRAKQEWERTFDAVPDLIAILDDNHRILRANRAMAKRLGLAPGQCVGKACHQAVHGLDRPPDFCPHALTLADGREHVAEIHEDCLGGDFLVSTTPLADEQGGRIGSVHVARDITGRKLREERISRLTKLYAVLSRVNEAIVRTRDEETLYGEVCRIIAEEGVFPLVWVGRVEGKQVAPTAACGPAADYLKDIRVEVEGELGRGPTGTSIREGRPVINDDFDTNSSAAPWREPAVRYGFRASAAFPLHRQGRVIGALTLYAAERGAFDPEQVNLLQALAADISYALDAIQLERLRTEAEKTLRKSEERLRLLSETAGRLLVAENPQAIVKDLCREVMAHLDCQAFFNFLVDEKAGRLHLNACAGIPEEEAGKIEWLDYGVAVCGCAARDGVRIVAENIFHTPDPRTELVKSYGIQAFACHPLMVQDRLAGTLSFGTKTRTSFSSEDLTLMRTVTDQVATAMERVRLIQELQRSRDELERRVQERTAEIKNQAELINLAHDAIIVNDMCGMITFWNNGAAEMYGWTDEEARGKIMKDLLQTEFPEPAEEMWARLVRQDRWEGELSHTRRDGKQIAVHSRWTLQRDEEGRPAGVMVINHDVTQRQKLEGQLRHAQKMEALGTLAGGIAHDFNNLLMPVILNTEGALWDIREGAFPSADNLKMVIEAAERGQQLVKQILTFSRQKEQQRKPVEITPTVKEALKFLRSTIPTTIEIRDHIETGSAIVLADPTQIYQVLMNLGNNAAHAMREKGGLLEVSLARMEVDEEMAVQQEGLRPGPYLRLTVKDDGHGMDRQVRERAFDPFFTTKKHGEGTGMGLAVVHGIVKNHEGAITLESEVGKGTTINVFLPLVQGRREAEIAPLEPIPGGDERILLVDDEEVQVRTVRDMLERLGYRVIGENDAQKALQIFRSQPDGFDLVITDQIMPRLTGDRLAREVLRIRPNIPIILCTGFSETVDEEEARAIGIREFAVKPFRARDLAQIIRRVLSPMQG